MFVVSKVAQTMCVSSRSVFHYSLSVCWYDWTPLAKVLHVIVGPTSADCMSLFAFLAFYTGDIIWSGGSTTASTFCYKNGSRGPFLGGQHDRLIIHTYMLWQHVSILYRCHWRRTWTIKNHCVHAVYRQFPLLPQVVLCSDGTEINHSIYSIRIWSQDY